MMRIATMLVLACPALVLAQTDPVDPVELHPIGGVFECSVQQTAEGDVLQLSCTETTSPRAEDWDYEITKVTQGTRYNGEQSGRISVWLRSNVAMDQMRLRVTFRYNDTVYVGEEQVWDSDILAGQTWAESVYSDFVPWTHVTIEADPTYGWTCKGCGTYIADDTPVSNAVDPKSIQPADIGRFLGEIQEALRGRR